MQVARCEPPRALVLHSRIDGQVPPWGVSSWAFVLEPAAPGAARLLVRGRSGVDPRRLAGRASAQLMETAPLRDGAPDVARAQGAGGARPGAGRRPLWVKVRSFCAPCPPCAACARPGTARRDGPPAARRVKYRGLEAFHERHLCNRLLPRRAPGRAGGGAAGRAPRARPLARAPGASRSAHRRGRARARGAARAAARGGRPAAGLGAWVDVALVEGASPQALADFCTQHTADLLVVGPPRADLPFAGAGGSLERMARGTALPLLRVTDPAPFQAWLGGQRPFRVMLGVDRSAGDPRRPRLARGAARVRPGGADGGPTSTTPSTSAGAWGCRRPPPWTR